MYNRLHFTGQRVTLTPYDVASIMPGRPRWQLLLLALLALTAASFRFVGGRRGISRHGSCNLLADVHTYDFLELALFGTVKWLLVTGVQVTCQHKASQAKGEHCLCYFVQVCKHVCT